MSKAGVLPLLSIALTGCAMFAAPGTRVPEIFAVSAGCNPESIRIDAATVDGVIPRIGWDACLVLAAQGAPIRVSTVQGAKSEVALWSYSYQGRSASVLLEKQAKTEERPVTWLVTSVSSFDSRY